MAKDAKGHGSNARGGSYSNIERSGFRRGEHVGYGGGTWRITKDGGRGYHATTAADGRYPAPVPGQSPGGGQYFHGTSLGHVSQQLSDRAAAKQLANDHPKSGPVPVHAGAAGRFNGGHFAGGLGQFKGSTRK